MSDPEGHKWRENKLYAVCENCGLVKKEHGPNGRCRRATPRKRSTSVDGEQRRTPMSDSTLIIEDIEHAIERLIQNGYNVHVTRNRHGICSVTLVDLNGGTAATGSDAAVKLALREAMSRIGIS